MNVRKEIDYSALFADIDAVMTMKLTQMELYREIGRLVAAHPAKGAAVAAADYLKQIQLDAKGFSSRNVRRMRDFYLSYRSDTAAMSNAMQIGWTQNVVILEADLTIEEKAWYIRAARKFGWPKLELLEKIATRAHEQIVLDTEVETCYTESTEDVEETDDESALCVSREDFTEKSLTLVFMRIQGLAADEFTTNLLLTTEPLHDIKNNK